MAAALFHQVKHGNGQAGSQGKQYEHPEQPAAALQHKAVLQQVQKGLFDTPNHVAFLIGWNTRFKSKIPENRKVPGRMVKRKQVVNAYNTLGVPSSMLLQRYGVGIGFQQELVVLCSG